MIKMTFFDMKDVVFVIKIANCKKNAKLYMPLPQVNRLGFWKILSMRVHFPLTSPLVPTSRMWRPRRGSTM